jgi:hypothetical protein
MKNWFVVKNIKQFIEFEFPKALRDDGLSIFIVLLCRISFCRWACTDVPMQRSNQSYRLFTRVLDPKRY